MAIALIAAWMGLLALLVKIGVLSGWKTWMKLSPIAIWLLCQLVVFIPMGFCAPSGPAVFMKPMVQIIPSVSGVVTDVQVRPGVSVKKGDPLFTIDSTVYEAEVDQLEAQVVLADQELKRLKELAGKVAGSTSQRDMDRAVAEVSRLDAELISATWNLEQTTVRAPVDGFVTHTLLRPGTRVVANTSDVMSFIDDSLELVLVHIDQSKLRKVEAGQEAEVAFKLYPGEVFLARVVRMVRATSEGTQLASGMTPKAREIDNEPFWVALELTEPPAAMYPGAVGTAAIYTQPSGMTIAFRKIVLRMESLMNFILPD